MHTYSTPPKENNHHFYNYYKGNNDDSGLGLHIDTLSLGLDFQQQRQQSNDLTSLHSCEPSLSPTGSPSSSSSSAATSPARKDSGVYIPHTHHRVARNRSTITRKSNAPSPQVTCQSWEHLKSPAASFLASFASPSTSGSNPSSSDGTTSSIPSTPSSAHRPSLSTFFEEQQGDEIDDYVMNQIIGYGGFSTVRKGYCISNGQTVAIKIIRKNGQENTLLEQELEVWQTLDHDNVVRIQKVLETDYATYVVCDYCANGTLLQHLLSHSLDLCEKKRLFSQLCSVVDYLHRKCNVIHKDIKLDNILLDDDMNIKLCDFGLAVYQRHSVAPTHLAKVARPGSPLSPPSTTSCAVGGSLAYCAPEQIKASYVLTCPKTDVWSLGVVLFAMFAGRLPFDDDYDVRLRSTILTGHYQIPDTFSAPLADLISHCLQSDPSQRYSLDQVMNHPWLK